MSCQTRKRIQQCVLAMSRMPSPSFGLKASHAKDEDLVARLWRPLQCTHILIHQSKVLHQVVRHIRKIGQALAQSYLMHVCQRQDAGCETFGQLRIAALKELAHSSGDKVPFRNDLLGERVRVYALRRLGGKT